MGASVSRNRGNVLNRVKLPVVFVPGVMGSRLSFTNFDVKWDPDASMHMLWRWAILGSAEVKRRWMDYISSPADIIGADEDFKEHRGKETVYEGYHEFLDWLGEREFGGADRLVECPVYTVGYDWRQSNWDSGYYLNTKIDEVLELEDVDQVIVITHSMGGLVTRAGLKRCTDMPAKVKGVIHVVQPVAGGLPLYRRLFTGMQPGLDYPESKLFSPASWIASLKGFIFAVIVGRDPHTLAAIVSATAGPMELLPTNDYRDVHPSEDLGKPWLFARVNGSTARDYDPETDQVWPQKTYDVYQLDSGPPGVYAPTLHDVSLKDSLRNLAGAAEAFHSFIGLSKHDNTWALYGVGEKTDMATAVTTTETVFPIQAEDGDGTVPGPSGAALFPAQAFNAESGDIDNLDNRQFEIPDVEHEPAFDNSKVRSAVEKILKLVISG